MSDRHRSPLGPWEERGRCCRVSPNFTQTEAFPFVCSRSCGFQRVITEMLPLLTSFSRKAETISILLSQNQRDPDRGNDSLGAGSPASPQPQEIPELEKCSRLIWVHLSPADFSCCSMTEEQAEAPRSEWLVQCHTACWPGSQVRIQLSISAVSSAAPLPKKGTELFVGTGDALYLLVLSAGKFYT